jgi:hypothetical protein
MDNTDYDRLRESYHSHALDEGNPFSTVKWDFYSRFDDTVEQERTDFCDVVIARIQNRAPWEPGADWTYLPKASNSD